MFYKRGERGKQRQARQLFSPRCTAVHTSTVHSRKFYSAVQYCALLCSALPMSALNCMHCDISTEGSRKKRQKEASKGSSFSHCEAYTAPSNYIVQHQLHCVAHTAPSNYIGQTHCSVTCSVSLAVWIVDCAIITVDTRGECSAEKSQGERLRCSVLTL